MQMPRSSITCLGESELPIMKFLKAILVSVSVATVFFGIVYHVVALPFSSPTFDFISWACIGIAALVLVAVGRDR